MKPRRDGRVRCSAWLGIVNQDMKSEMKTPEQWLEIIRARGATTQPAGTLRLVRQIQDDALEYAAGLCIQHAHTGHPEGWTDTVSQECARIINSKRVTAMPNDKVSDGGPLAHELKQDANPPFAAPLG